MSETIRIDDQRSLEPLSHNCPGSTSETPIAYGFMFKHPRRDNGAACEGGVKTCGLCAGPAWSLEGASDALTLSPSIHCLACGEHGFVRDGKWIPA